jgi:hypothetical protein
MARGFRCHRIPASRAFAAASATSADSMGSLARFLQQQEEPGEDRTEQQGMGHCRVRAVREFSTGDGTVQDLGHAGALGADERAREPCCQRRGGMEVRQQAGNQRGGRPRQAGGDHAGQRGQVDSKGARVRALVVRGAREGQTPPAYVGIALIVWAALGALIFEPSPFVLGVIPGAMLVAAARSHRSVTA